MIFSKRLSFLCRHLKQNFRRNLSEAPAANLAILKPDEGKFEKISKLLFLFFNILKNFLEKSKLFSRFWVFISI